MAGGNLPDDGVVFAGGVFCTPRRGGPPGSGLVGGHLHDVQLVGGVELLLFGQGGAGHTGELPVQTEVVLEGDGGQGSWTPGPR